MACSVVSYRLAKGMLSGAPHIVAECHIRLMPPTAQDGKCKMWDEREGKGLFHFVEMEDLRRLVSQEVETKYYRYKINVFFLDIGI